MRRLLFLFLILPVVCFAQSNSFVVKAPTLVAIGEPFRVEFVANGKITDFKAPSFDGFNVIAGPTTSSSSNVSYVNGNITKFEEYSYTYVLVGKEAGNALIKSATAKMDGKSVSTKELPIEVVKESNNSNNQNQNQGQAASQGQNRQSSTANNIGEDDILLRVIPSKTSLYLGEPLSLKLKLYSRARISNLQNVKLATFDGFWNQELEVNDEPAQRETYKNKVYDTWVIKEFLLFPQKVGKLDISKMSVDVMVSVVLNTPSGGSLFDSFFGGGQVTNFTKTISTYPIAINVKSLPQGAPASFSGAVGDFTIKGAMNESKISANASNALVLTISGDGNFPLISTPKINLPSSFELYPSKSKDNYYATLNTITGSKTFDYPFIARAEGNYNLNGVEFSYFSPTKQQYVTLTTDDFELDVLKDVTNRSTTGSSIISSVTKDDLKILGQDIHFIKVGDSNLKPKDRFLVGSWIYVVVILLLIAIFVSAILYMKKYIKEMRDTVKQRNKKANKVAISRLKKAKKFKTDNMENEFYSEMLRALTGYIGDKLNIEVSKLSKENINEALVSRKVADSDIEQLLKTISDCEFAQYSPISNVTMSSVYDNTLDLIGRLESKL